MQSVDDFWIEQPNRIKIVPFEYNTAYNVSQTDKISIYSKSCYKLTPGHDS